MTSKLSTGGTRRRGQLIGAALAAGVGALAAYAFAVRPWHMGWGATEEELKETLPGDEFVHDNAGSATHAVTIDAPAWAVWPWLAQIGQDRGGFYSYTWLENLVGCRMRNADHIVPEFQHLKVGDAVRLHPKVPPLPVLICEPYSALVLGSNTVEPGTWGLYLKEIDDNTTRLIARGRGRISRGLLGRLVQYAVFEPAHFVMERKMLLEIKLLAEREAHRDSEKLPRGLDMEWSGPKVVDEG